MAKFEIELMGIEELEKELLRLDNLQFDKVRHKSLKEIFNRTKENTPVGNYTGGGQLRKDSKINGDEVGYTKEYAPDVEYGHRQEPGRYVPAIKKRLKAKFVPGQYFFKKNVDIQREIYHKDLKRLLKNERGEF